jgi:hypothetical protein
MKAKAQDLLNHVYGHHQFRPGQQELVEGLLENKDVLGVMPTGSGKSLCYQIPALLFSHMGVSQLIPSLLTLFDFALKPYFSFTYRTAILFSLFVLPDAPHPESRAKPQAARIVNPTILFNLLFLLRLFAFLARSYLYDAVPHHL